MVLFSFVAYGLENQNEKELPFIYWTEFERNYSKDFFLPFH